MNLSDLQNLQNLNSSETNHTVLVLTVVLESMKSTVDELLPNPMDANKCYGKYFEREGWCFKYQATRAEVIMLMILCIILFRIS